MAKIIVGCAECSKKCIKQECYLKNHKNVFCSRVCFNKFKSAHPEIYQPISKKLDKICKNCSASFKTYPSLNADYCSKKCLTAFVTGKPLLTNRLSTEEFIAKAKEKHGDRYDYSLTNYITSNDKIKIICPVHGVREQLPNDHLRNTGCRSCGYIQSRKSNTEIDQVVFEQRCNEIHENFYDYSKTKYVDLKTKVIIICPIHGEFEQSVTGHMVGKGCWKCAGEQASINNRDSKEGFIGKAKIIHGDRYDYSLVDFKNHHDRVKIICPSHGVFEMSPNSHISRKSKCRKCAKQDMKDNESFYNFTKARWIKITKECDFYLIRLYNDTESFYKVGIAKDIVARFKSTKNYQYEIINTFHSLDAGLVWQLEKDFHMENKHLKHAPLKELNGFTECYIPDDQVIVNFKEKIKSFV